MPARDSNTILQAASLAGARIWLSGAVPETEGTTEEQRAPILDFVRRFARRVFERGGHIVYGSHPSWSEFILDISGHLEPLTACGPRSQTTLSPK